MNGDVSTMPPVRIGIASCVLGEHVRFDGNHKRDAFLVEVFGPHVTWVPVCPEVEMGLGVPRETMRLEQHGHEIRLVTPKTGADHTDRLRTFAAQRLAALSQEGPTGGTLRRDLTGSLAPHVQNFTHSIGFRGKIVTPSQYA